MSGRIEESVWEERRLLIDQQEKSGLSVAEFCREHGLHARTFHAWRYRLAASCGGGSATGKAAAGGKKRQAFIQLPQSAATAFTGSAVTAVAATWVEFSLADGLVVRVPASNLAALQVVLNGLNRAALATVQEPQRV